MSFEKLVTVYGPIGLGWPLFIWCLVRLIKTNEELTKIVENNTKALTLLAERIRVRHGDQD